MKFCKNCGAQLADEAAFCTNCGTQAEQAAPQQAAPQQPVQQAYAAPQQQYAAPQQQYAAPQQAYPQQAYAQQPYAPARPTSGITTAAKVFMILGTILTSIGGYLIPLAWCLPMTIVYFKKLKTGQPIGTGFKVCSLLFVSLLGGIFMLCDKEH